LIGTGPVFDTLDVGHGVETSRYCTYHPSAPKQVARDALRRLAVEEADLARFVNNERLEPPVCSNVTLYRSIHPEAGLNTNCGLSRHWIVRWRNIGAATATSIFLRRKLKGLITGTASNRGHGVEGLWYISDLRRASKEVTNNACGSLATTETYLAWLVDLEISDPSSDRDIFRDDSVGAELNLYSNSLASRGGVVWRRRTCMWLVRWTRILYRLIPCAASNACHGWKVGRNIADETLAVEYRTDGSCWRSGASKEPN
jgi:hypothetical protein